MGFTASIVKATLSSDSVRRTFTGAADGIRNITKADKDKKSGGFWGALVQFVGWALLGGGNILSFTATTIVSWFWQSVFFIWNFNWNMTDEDIDRQFAQYKSILFGQVGGTLGNLTGWLLCGVAPGAYIFTFNEALALKILADVGEEMFEEFTANVRMLCQSLIRIGAMKLFYESFKGARRFLKAQENGVKSVDDAGNLLYGPQWREAKKSQKTNKPWSFATAFNDSLESVGKTFGPEWENFLEEFFEETLDACMEASYVVAGGIDQWVIEQNLQKISLLGNEEIIEIQPNREVEEERIIIAGPQQLIKPVIAQTLTTHQILEERDLGMWVGEPVREFLKSPPISIQLRIILTDKEGTLYKAKRKQITIPNVDRAKLDWADIKAAVGGANGYMWGRFRGSAKLDSGHQLEVYAATDQEAIDRINALIRFSKSEILGITVIEEKREGKRKTIDALYKQPTRIYPYAFTIVNQQKILNEESGLATLSGTYKRKKASMIDLTTDTRPDDFAEVISELFRIPGANG